MTFIPALAGDFTIPRKNSGHIQGYRGQLIAVCIVSKGNRQIEMRSQL